MFHSFLVYGILKIIAKKRNKLFLQLKYSECLEFDFISGVFWDFFWLAFKKELIGSLF